MIIECSNCQQKYKIRDDIIPEGKIGTLNCKKCGAKIHLDFRENKLKNENVNVSKLKTDNLPPTPEPQNETHEKSLKEKILAKIEELPPLPRVVIEISDLISNPNSDAKKIAEVIETDQAIAAKVLKVANSAYYGMSGKISSIQHASIVLGNRAIGEIVAIAGSEDTLDGKLPGYGYDTKDLWEHSLAVAFGSKIIAEMANYALVNEAYTAGLIHDVGKIILDDSVLEHNGEIKSFMQAEEKTFLDAESHFFVFNHAEIAFEVCKKWNLPESMNAAIRGHHQPSNSASTDLTYILHMADYIARLSGIGYDDDDFLYDIEEGTMDHLSLKQEDVSNIVLKVSESVEKISSN
jgi:putative nucleotidyltransferase with HDIG domain